MEKASGRDRVMILGLDGATFDLLMPLVRRGELPNLARLIEGGVHGRGEGEGRGQT